MAADKFAPQDMRALSALLKKAVSPHLSRDGTDDFRILNLACGSCDEADTLVKFAQDHSTGGVNLIGADIRIREILQARETHAKLPAEFLLQDASKLSNHKELGESFNMVLLRHQNYWHGRDLWKKIFEQGLEKTGEDGLLVITSYFDKEHQLALEALNQLGAELIGTHANEAARRLFSPGKSVDKHIAVFRRKQ
jgi:SAM-dependent methyltransferase